MRTPTTLLSLLLAAALPLVLPRAAPEGPATPQAGSPTPDESIDDISRRVSDGASELRALEEESRSKSEDERRVLERRIRERRAQVLAAAYELVDRVVEAESAGESAGESRTVAEDYLKRASEGLRRRLLETMAELDRLRDSRDSKTGDALVDHTEQIARTQGRVDTLLGELMTNVVKMEQLGLDAGKDRALLGDLLTEHTEDLLARLEVFEERAAVVRERLVTTPDDANLQARARAHEIAAASLEKSIEVSLGLLEQLGRPTDEARRRLIRLTGNVTTDIFDTDVAVGLFESWVEDARAWLSESGPALFFKAVIFTVIVMLFWLLARIVARLVRRSVVSSKLNLSQLLQDILVTLISRGVLFLGILLALSQVGVSLGPVLAGLGIAGFIVGFALQDTLGNFAAGVMILVYRPYDVNDLIEAGGVFGKVGRMSLVSTTILTLDNQTLVVPNSKIWGDVIKNVTAQKIRRIDMTFGISYGDDIRHAESVLQSILDDEKRVLADPAPVIKLHELGDSSVNFIVRPWVRTADYWDVYWHVTREVKVRFDAEGISIPFPQRDVHLHRTPPDAR